MIGLCGWRLTSLLLPGCTSRVDAAHDLFVRARTRPAKRVQIIKLDGPALHELRQQKWGQNPPQAPTDVQAEPSRLALWQARQAEAARTRQRADDRFLHRASGCGQQQDHACEFLWSQ